MHPGGAGGGQGGSRSRPKPIRCKTPLSCHSILSFDLQTVDSPQNPWSRSMTCSDVFPAKISLGNMQRRLEREDPAPGGNSLGQVKSEVGDHNQ